MENKNKIIIIALIVIIVALLVGIFAMMPNTTKKDTNLTFNKNSTFTEGDSLKIKLTDSNGTAIPNQTVNVTIVNKDKSKYYHSVQTNSKGVGTLKLDKNAGKYNVVAVYGGNDNYTGCNATKKITIEEKVDEVEPASSSSSSDTTPRYTTDEHGTYDNVRDMYIDRQAKGLSKSELQYYEDLERRNGGRAD